MMAMDQVQKKVGIIIHLVIKKHVLKILFYLLLYFTHTYYFFRMKRPINISQIRILNRGSKLLLDMRAEAQAYLDINFVL